MLVCACSHRSDCFSSAPERPSHFFFFLLPVSQDKASLIDASATTAVIDRSKTAVENMINLDPMTADTLLENIRIRYTGLATTAMARVCAQLTPLS